MPNILYPIEWVVATIMVGFERLLTTVGMSDTSGWTWVLSIAGLVVVIRVLLIPLFVKQIKSSRRMQLIQPEMRKIQQKYKGRKDQASRQAMTQETMDLYKRTGTNPFASCLPILLQMPIFFALFRVLNSLPSIANGTKDPIGPLSAELAGKAEASTFLGAPLSATFLRADDWGIRGVILVLILLMSALTFWTSRMMMRKNMPASALDNPMAKQQELIMYLMPIIFGVTGVGFPVGVLLYWTITNLWSLGQQTYVIKRMPAPGSAAEAARHERLRAKGKEVKKETLPGLESSDDKTSDKPAAPKSGQRVQPKSHKRSKKKRKR